MSFRALTPKKYKQNILQGAIHRITHATSSWRLFHTGIEKLTSVLEANQYSLVFMDHCSGLQSKISVVHKLRGPGSLRCTPRLLEPVKKQLSRPKFHQMFFQQGPGSFRCTPRSPQGRGESKRSFCNTEGAYQTVSLGSCATLCFNHIHGQKAQNMFTIAKRSDI